VQLPFAEIHENENKEMCTYFLNMFFYIIMHVPEIIVVIICNSSLKALIFFSAESLHWNNNINIKDKNLQNKIKHKSSGHFHIYGTAII